jgi:Domain of unknown function (DUF4404)
MTDPKFRAVVQQIREQLARAHDLAPAARESLEALVRDLEAVADRRAGTGGSDAEGLRARLADAVRRYEASHPVLSTTLGNVIDALAFFGL